MKAKRKWDRELALLIGAIALMLVLLYIGVEAILTHSEDIIREDIQNQALQIGEEAPDFTVKTVEDGLFTLSENRGKPVILHFWATWSEECEVELPSIQRLYEEWADAAVIVGISYWEEARVVQNYMREQNLTYPVGLDEEGSLMGLQYKSNSIPYTVVIDASGVITHSFHEIGEGAYDVLSGALGE